MNPNVPKQCKRKINYNTFDVWLKDLFPGKCIWTESLLSTHQERTKVSAKY